MSNQSSTDTTLAAIRPPAPLTLARDLEANGESVKESDDV